MPDTLRIAAIADVHYGKATPGKLQSLFLQIAESADVMVLCGDLTDYGLAEEAKLLARDLASLPIPIVGVLGNHDYQSDQEGDVRATLEEVGVHMLDGDSWDYRGVGFAGVRGFCGGFGRGALGSWGEPVIKAFVQETVNEAFKLEAALARISGPHRIVLMHYSPIKATLEGESPEIFPFLGSSRLEDPLSRFEVTAVFHGHAHKGSPEGKTAGGIPVYNVAYPVLQASYRDRPPFRLFEVHVEQPEANVTPIGDRAQWGRRASDRVG